MELPGPPLPTLPQPSPEPTKAPAFRALQGNILPGALALPINADLHLTFSHEIDNRSFDSKSMIVTCNDGKEPMPGVASVKGRDAIFQFERRFFVGSTQGMDGTLWTGLKPASKCEVTINEAVRSRGGIALASESRHFRFSTVKNDFGIYWFGADGAYEKAVPGVTSTLYDPSKPVLLFLHGWQNTTTKNSFFRENPFVFQNPNYGSRNLLPLWKKRDYNIAIFYWPQFADEPDVKDAEAKVWRGNSEQTGADGLPVRMRFRLPNEKWNDTFSTEKSISEILLDEYLRTLAGFSGPGIRLVAHSLGSQLSINFLHLLSKEVKLGKASAKLFPSRLVILDPFWSKGGRPYLNNRWTGEVCREYMTDIIKNHELAFEYVKTSLVGSHFAGDRNLDLRAQAAYYRVRPAFISILDQNSLHWYAYVWYLGSIDRPYSLGAEGSFGAAASDAEIRTRMKAQSKKALTLWHQGGRKTPEVEDDVFKAQVGVDGG